MRKAMDYLAIKAMTGKEHLKEKCKAIVTGKHPGVDGVVVSLILIVVAVAAMILFRNTIMTPISTALETVDAKITTLFSGSATGVS